MQYYRCKCGKNEAWGSMSPYQCAGCSECGTTLDTSPELHRAPKPHDFVATKVETDEGERTLGRCKYCGRTRNEILKVEADGFFILNGKRYDTVGPIHGADVRAKLPPECAVYYLEKLKAQIGERRVLDADRIPSGIELIAVPPAHG